MLGQKRVSQMVSPMLSHYLRANTWPQKFLPESASLGLGQFSVFSVIGVGQEGGGCLYSNMEKSNKRGIPSSWSVVVSPTTHRTTQAFLTTIPNPDTLSNMGPKTQTPASGDPFYPCVCGSGFALEQRTRCPSICETREFVVV